jgi:hypothetical protein
LFRCLPLCFYKVLFWSFCKKLVHSSSSSSGCGYGAMHWWVECWKSSQYAGWTTQVNWIQPCAFLPQHMGPNPWRLTGMVCAGGFVQETLNLWCSHDPPYLLCRSEHFIQRRNPRCYSSSSHPTMWRNLSRPPWQASQKNNWEVHTKAWRSPSLGYIPRDEDPRVAKSECYSRGYHQRTMRITWEDYSRGSRARAYDGS